ncbi:MAG: ThiF family adenylyltransferase, partial [Spirochaetaceae bacterium]|nr:ThiF family adenylyltransferase [Spirochaetaceae bacterium]
MIPPFLRRMALIAGEDGVAAFARSRVLVFGLGGVGGWCAEALARSGIGSLTLVDSDRICVTNINRQVQATAANVGEDKAGALRSRILSINPAAQVDAVCRVFSKETAASFPFVECDYVVDAIDSVSCKLDLIEKCAEAGVPVFSSMGMAQKFDPARIKIASIWDTEGCPLARLVRQGLRKRGFCGDFTAVYSAERQIRRVCTAAECTAANCLCPKPAAGGPDWCSTKKV